MNSRQKHQGLLLQVHTLRLTAYSISSIIRQSDFINSKVQQEGREGGKQGRREGGREGHWHFFASLLNFPMLYEVNVLCNFPVTLIKDVM